VAIHKLLTLGERLNQMRNDSNPNPIFESFWRFAAERHRIYGLRLLGDPGPWTQDEILTHYKFTNAFRAADRVSQYLLSQVIYRGDQSANEVIFRTLLFKIFNRIDTWVQFEVEFGFPNLGSFDAKRYGALLQETRTKGHCIYSNAYIIPPLPGAGPTKHEGHLRMISKMMDDGLPKKIGNSQSLRAVYEELSTYAGLGPFLAYQFTIDLNYSSIIDHDEDEFVVAGPGALDGASKMFPEMHKNGVSTLIRRLADEQEKWFESYGLRFDGLFGRRLHLIDVQNLLCEISKYSRVAFPEVVGSAGRTRIKQRFDPTGPLPAPFFPPKWHLSHVVDQPNLGNACRPLTPSLSLL
jgi:hypothetical protein